MESWLGKWELANLEGERRKRVRIGDHTCFQLKMTIKAETFINERNAGYAPFYK
jgi:hypothetical protein